MENPKIKIIVKELGRMEKRSNSLAYHKEDNELLNKLAEVIAQHHLKTQNYEYREN